MSPAAPRGSSTASRAGAGRERVGVPLQLGQVVERVGLVQLAGVDQAHEQVADAGAVPGLVEQGVLAVQDRLLQRPLAQVVVQRGTGLTQEQRQLIPVLEHVTDRAAEGRIGLGPLLVQLPRQPVVQVLHRRPARLLMKPQTRLGRQPTLPRDGVVAIDHGQRFEQVATRLGKAIVDIDEPPPGMGQAMRQDRPQLARQVARQGVAHLDRRRQLLGAVLEDLGQVLARVPAAAEEQRDPVAVAQGDHARGVQAPALVGVVRVLRGIGQGLLPASLLPSAPGS